MQEDLTKDLVLLLQKSLSEITQSFIQSAEQNLMFLKNPLNIIDQPYSHSNDKNTESEQSKYRSLA